MDALAEIAPWAQVSAAGILLAVAFWLIRVVVKGDFVPRQTVDLLLASRDGEIQRAVRRGDDWRDAYQTQVHANEVVRSQLGELIEYARTADHVLETLEAKAHEAR